MRGAGLCRRRTQASRKKIAQISRNSKVKITVHTVITAPNASFNASPRPDTCAETKSRAGATTESLASRGLAQSGFALWSCRASSAPLRPGAEGPKLPQQSLCATLHGLGSGSGTLAARWLQQAVEVDVGVVKIDVGEDPRQRCRRQDARLGLSRRAKAKGDIFKSTDQEREQLGGAVLVESSLCANPWYS